MSWPSVTLDDVSVHIRNGASIKQSNDAKGLPITRIETIAAREINLKKCGYADVGENDFLGHRLDSGDILISHINSEKHLGKCAIYEGTRKDIVHGMNLLCLRPKQEIIFPRFLFHYLSSLVFLQMIPAITKKSVNQASFTVTAFKFLEIPLPPLTEQKRIAAILDKADAIRRKRQQAIQLADDFLRAVFLDMFGDPVTNPKGWEVKTIECVSAVQGGLQVSKKRFGLPMKAPYLRVANVLRNRLNLSEIKEIELTESEYSRVLLKADDLLVVEGHGNENEIGRCAIWNGEINGIVHQNHLIRIRVNSKSIKPQFLSDYINSSGGRTQMTKASNTTSGLNTISTGVVKSTQIIVPPLILQDKYISIVSLVNKNLRSQNLAHVNIDETFNSLSQKAFRGDL